MIFNHWHTDLHSTFSQDINRLLCEWQRTSPDYKTESWWQQFPKFCLNFFPDIWTCPFQERFWFSYLSRLIFLPSVNSTNTIPCSGRKSSKWCLHFRTPPHDQLSCDVLFISPINIRYSNRRCGWMITTFSSLFEIWSQESKWLWINERINHCLGRMLQVFWLEDLILLASRTCTKKFLTTKLISQKLIWWQYFFDAKLFNGTLSIGKQSKTGTLYQKV